MFVGFERGGSDARHGRRAPVEFAQSKTQAAQPVPQRRLSDPELRFAAPPPPARRTRDQAPSRPPCLPAPDQLIVLYTAPMDSTKLDHPPSLRGRLVLLRSSARFFFPPKRFRCFLSRSIAISACAYSSNGALISAFRFCSKFCASALAIAAHWARSLPAWPRLIATQSLVCKNWASTGVSDSITQDTTNNNAEHLSGGKRARQTGKKRGGRVERNADQLKSVNKKRETEMREGRRERKRGREEKEERDGQKKAAE